MPSSVFPLPSLGRGDALCLQQASRQGVKSELETVMEQLFFYIFAILAVASAIAVVASKNPVHSAVYLIICFLQVAALFILLRAPFLAAAQVFIYVGAVMVLFLFAVLVLNVGKERLGEQIHHQSVIVIPAVILFLLMVGALVVKGGLTAPMGEFTEKALEKNTEVIGKMLLSKYIFPFEVVSVLLLIALIGAVALVMKGRGNPD